ncbi:MAG: nucleotide exchange factor GrpE, partial [Gemmatimonadota bacterium]|nr:nucleotide exchange factor GrpE [Gemmatimonadota bacterium]
MRDDIDLPNGPAASHDDAADGADGDGNEDAAAAVAGSNRELDEQRDRYLRLAAEYDNYRKRSQKERQEAGARAQGELVKSLIDSLDDLMRVTAQDPEIVDAKTIHQGIEVVNKKLMKALGMAGLELIDPVDQTFDPAQHEAVSTEPALSPEDDHLVSRVFQQGYRYNGQLLRPARVVVK